MNRYPTASEVLGGPPERWVSYFLMCSYLYYICDKSIWSDHEFDSLCNKLLHSFDEIEHPHKHLITKDALEAGTGFALRESDYPAMVVGAASEWWYALNPQDRPKVKRKKR